MLFNSRPSTSTLSLVPDGVDGVIAALQMMADAVFDGRKSIVVREKAVSLASFCAPKDTCCEVDRVFEFVRDDIRYVLDTRDVELVQTPEYTLRHGSGDCGQKVTLLCALLESIGLETRFVAVGYNSGIYSHVYAEVKCCDKWVPLDASENVDVGWFPPGPIEKLIFEIY